MPKKARNQKKYQTRKSQEIIFKQPSLFRKIVSFITAYSVMFLNITPVFATNITGVQGNNGVYNIEAEKISGSTGFRKYTDFTLDDGDVANLQFKKGSKEYGKFVNMVDNKININGIVNTVKGDAFYNGHAIFVSPNGIVVGASGVLNVGSLTLATPNNDKYEDLTDAFDDGDLGDYEHGGDQYNKLLSESNGNITVNGKIMARNDVELYGKNITIEGKNGGRAGIVAGVKNQSKITSRQQAEDTFNALVSNNIKNADTFTLEGGKIKIKAGSTEAEDSVKSAKIEIKNADLGANEVDIKAEVSSEDKIDMVKTEINLENTDITADKIDIKAESKREHALILGNNEYIDGFNTTIVELLTDILAGDDTRFPFGATGAAEAEVTIKNSTLQALKEDIAVKAIASYSHTDNMNLMKPAMLMMLIDLFKEHGDDQEIEPDDASFTQFFGGGVYEGFDGPRTRATVTIDNTAVTAHKGDIGIFAEASSELKLSTGIEGLIIPVAIYGFGTGTVARAIVKNHSALTAQEGDVNISAFSENTNEISLVNAGLTSLTIEDFFIFALINNTVKTSTEAKLEDSTVKTGNLAVSAVNLNTSEVDIEIETLAGMNDQQGGDEQEQTHGNSAVSVVGIMHHSDNNVSAIIKNSTVTSENTAVLAQSINSTSNSGDASVCDPTVVRPDPYWNSDILRAEQQFSLNFKIFQWQHINKSIFNRIKGGAGFLGQQGATLEAGGVFVWSNTQNNATAKIENSTVTATNDVSVQANTIDVLTNASTSDTAGRENISLSITAIINEEKNTTTADVSNSKIDAENLTVNATTEMPMIEGELIFGIKLPFKIKGIDGAYAGVGFGRDADQAWDFDFAHPEIDSDAPWFDMGGLTSQTTNSNYEELKPRVRWSGFFNNFAQTNGIGENKVAIDGSFIYNEVINNTTASVSANSDIVLHAIQKEDGSYEGGNLIVNAVNSVVGWNALGMVDFLIRQINYKIPGQINWGYEPQAEAGKLGLGVNFLWDIYTNNAIAKIDNSSVDAKNGSVIVGSANEQEYVTAEVTGGKSELIGIDGSTNVQKIYGETTAQILNSKNITSGKVEVNAGKATIKAAGSEPKIDENTGQAQLNDIRDAEDVMTIINFLPAWSAESTEQGAQQTTSSGVAVGASVDVTNIERTVTAEIKNSTVISDKDIDVKANTYSQAFNILAAAAWSGGVTQPQPDGGEQGGGEQGGGEQHNNADNQPANRNDIANVQQNLDDAQDDDDDDLVEHLLDDEEDFVQNPLGDALPAIRNKFSLSLAGAVLVFNDKTDAAAKISNSDITAGKDINVTADREARMITVSGGVSKAGKIGAGAAIDVYKSDGSVKAVVADSTVKFAPQNTSSKFDVKAHNTNKLLNIAVGVGLTPDANVNDESIKAAVGGSYNMNTLKPTIEAGIQNSTVKAREDGQKVDVNVNAENDIVVYDIAGGGMYMNGGSTSLGAGAAINYNNIKHTISSYIKNSTLDDINKLSVTADADNNLSDFAVAGSLVLGAQTSGWVFDGSANVDYIHDTIKAQILGSTITADDDIIVKADSNSNNLALAGTLDVTMTQSGIGVNGDVVVNVFRNNITAEIDNSYKEIQKQDNTVETVLDQAMQILKAKDVKVSATSTEKSNVILSGLAVGTSGQFLMAAANIGVNLVDNAVKANVSGNIGTGKDAEAVHDVTVSAYDETTLYSRGGTVGVSVAEDAIAVFAASINVDKLDKTVEANIKNADIKATGTVSATAASVNSMGGTKNEDNEYSSDDVTTEAYREKMLHKNTDTDEYDGLKLKKKNDDSDEYIALDQDSDFWNWNMFYDIAASQNVAVSGTGIGKVISNTVKAEISGSKIEADRLDVIADDYSIKNVIAGTISGAGKGSVGLQVLYTKDNSTTNALITGSSELKITNAINMDATNHKDNHNILVAGSGAQYFVVNGNTIINNVTDEVIAKIDNGSTQKAITAGIISVNADEYMNISHIVVTGGGAKNIALNISPLVNNYDGTTEASIKNAFIKDAAIDMDAESKIDTLDVTVGFSGVYQGGAGIGIAIKNNYTNNVKAYIDNAIINTSGNIFIDANSVIDSTNWLVGIAGSSQGADLLVNVLLNNVTSELESGIKNSTIEKSGTITINANKDKKDKIVNRAIAAGAVFQGASLIANAIKNVYKNTVNSYVENTGSTTIDSLSINAYSDRITENANVGISVAAEGAGLLGAAIANEIGSTTRAYVDVGDKTLNITNALSLDTKDQMAANNAMGTIKVGIYGGTSGVNVNLYYSDNLVKSEIISSTSGQINAGSSSLQSELINAVRNAPVEVTFGLGAIPVDVQIIGLGKKTDTYSVIEQQFIDQANSMIPETLYTPTTASDDIKTGAISSITGNLKTKNNTQVNAKTKLQGLDANQNLTDLLKLENTHVTPAGAQINVGIRRVDIAGNTVTEIVGKKVESTQGDIALNTESKSNVEIDSTAVDAGGAQVSGRSVKYYNSAETIAQIKNATVNAGDIDVKSQADNKTLIDATAVEAVIGGVVTVDLAEAYDTNRTVALITGNTNINATGKLSLQATASTDLTSEKSSVPVQIADIVGVSRNRAEVNSIARAIIENVNGTINTDGLDIITDYDKMLAYSQSNIVAVKPIDLVSYDDSGAFMNANFESGIDSKTGLTLVNSGTTNIIAARDNQTDAAGMVAKGNIHNVHISAGNAYTGAFSKAENTATSSTVLKVKEHTSQNLNIDQYLHSTATADAGNNRITLLGFASAAAADAKDTSAMNLDIDGSNTVVQNAVINATHNSKIKSDLSAFNLGVIVSGGRIRIDSELDSKTTANIGGKFNAGDATVNINTYRDSTMSKSSGSGGFINVSDTETHNTLTGDSILNITNLTTDSDNINNWSISNKSENIFDVETTDGSGGFVNVSPSNTFLNFSTSTATNVENSNITAKGKVKIEVGNKEILREDAWNNGGGFISVINNYTLNTYNTGAKLLIKDSQINARDLDLKTSSDMRTNSDDYIEYTGSGGGAFAFSWLTLINKLTQTSEIELQNSVLHATHNAVLEAVTSSLLKQKMKADYRGLVSIPRFLNNITVDNTNKLSLDDKSKIIADEKLDISFNSNNDLAVHTLADARNFEGAPAAWAELYLTINNIIDNNGSLQAGNLVDIDYMNNSINNLYQYAHSENDAFIASTTEDGTLSRTINNVLNVNSGADIISGKDIDISYDVGVITPSSEVSWVTNSLWFIEDSDKKSVDNPSNNYSLKNEGTIIAGQGNNRYMRINRDGTIDMSTLTGFYDGDYTLYDGQPITGQEIKESNLALIKTDLQNIQEALDELEVTISGLETTINYFETKKQPIGEKLDEINGLIADGYTPTESKSDSDSLSDFNAIIQNDLNALITDENNENAITQEQYDLFLSDYGDKVAEIQAYNTENAEQTEFPTLLEFLNDYDFTDGQKATIATGYNTVNANIKRTAIGQFMTYENNSGKYLAVTDLDQNQQTFKELTQTQSEFDLLTNQINAYSSRKTSNEATQNALNAQMEILQAEYDNVSASDTSKYEQVDNSYSIVFNDIDTKTARINIDGAYNTNISGNGEFKVASSGVTIDNYSTRSLVFGLINVEPSDSNGLFINSKNHYEFANKPQAVSGEDAYSYINDIPGHKTFDELPTDGVHYVRESSDITGVTINNLYDTNHPLASTFDIPYPTTESNIFLVGNIDTQNLNVWNESGDILTLSDIIRTDIMNMYATNGQIGIVMPNDSQFALSAGSKIFAADGVFINTDNVDIKGDIKTGYSDRSITITEDMLNDLIEDPTSGEVNMINLGGEISPYLNAENNIKAIYKDGEIYLYNIPETTTNNGVGIARINGSAASGSITGNITVADGYQNITIDNQTDKKLNVADITNAYFDGNIATDGIFAESANITKNANNHAETNITSGGQLVLNGFIRNNVRKSSVDNSYMVQTANGILNITADNGLDIAQKINSGNIVDTIFAGGTIDITVNGGNADIAGNITDRGNIAIYNYGNDNFDINGNITDTGNITVQNDGAGKLTLNGEIVNKRGDISVWGTGTGATVITNTIKTNQGNIFIASKGLTATEESQISAEKGDVDVINNADTLALYGSVSANNGNISIGNNGTSATVGGVITDENGDIMILNTQGDMTISSAITHDYLTPDTAGIITIINNPEGGDLNIQADIKTWSSGTVEDDKNTAVLIDNRSASGNMIIGNSISAQINDIVIKNAANDLLISGTIFNDGQGNINITNEGKDIVNTAAISVKSGDINITSFGNGKAQIGGSIIDESGNINIASSGAQGAEISGTLTGNGGDIAIRNTEGDLTFTHNAAINGNSAGDISISNDGNGKLTVGGTIDNNTGGELSVVNSGANGMEISGTITNAGGNTLIENKKSDLRLAENSVLESTVPANIEIKNTSGAAALIIAGKIGTGDTGNVTISNDGSDKLEIAENGEINITKGELNIINADGGALKIAGLVDSSSGNTVFTNTSDDGMFITTTARIINNKHYIKLDNSGADGIKIEGKLTALRQGIVINNRDSDLVIGEYASANDNYLQTASGNVNINQIRGNVLNGVVDTAKTKHQNADLGNPQQSYKTLIASGGDLTINIIDGNIGYAYGENAGFTVEASSRDWTDSINVNIHGNITATATNDNQSDARLINLRAKYSDLNIKNITADGNVLLTAADWKQADVRPTPDDDAYFSGYSVINAAKESDTAIFGRNISVIASNTVGTADKKLTYIQDTAANPQSAVNFEAENDIYTSGDSNSDVDVRINQIISKRGSIIADFNKNATINKITAANGIEITQKAQNLTILDLGASVSDKQPDFDDILNPHDDLVYSGDPQDADKSVVPQNVILRVLDAVDTPERGASELKVYSMTVRGNNDENGKNSADVTLMADNIYINSDKAPNSSVSTKANPEGYQQTLGSYNSAEFGFGDNTQHSARGINSYGEGNALSIDVIGVDKEVVESFVDNPQRNQYAAMNQDNSALLGSGEDNVYNSRVQNAAISVNDYASEERGVVFNTLYADNAYINTLDTDLLIKEGYINNYAEIRNGDRAANKNRYTVVIDNDYRRMVPANAQLYTAQTGKFGLMLGQKIQLLTPAPIIHFDGDKTVGSDNQESFVLLGLRETEMCQKAKNYHINSDADIMPQSLEQTYQIWQDDGLSLKVIEINRFGATIINSYNWQVGEEHELDLTIDGTQATIKCVVTKVMRNLATVAFVDIPSDIANKIANHYVKTAEND